MAISYIDRFDLAHVDPSEADYGALGKGETEGRAEAPGAKYVSKGLTRSRTDKLAVVSGGATGSPSPGGGGSSAEARSSSEGGRGGVTNVTALHAAGATALKAEPEAKLSPAQALETLPWQQPQAHAQPQPTKAERRAEAKARGYEGEMCNECANFTLVRNGTCMKCDTCGSTTGCS